MEAGSSSETSVSAYKTTRCHEKSPPWQSIALNRKGCILNAIHYLSGDETAFPTSGPQLTCNKINKMSHMSQGNNSDSITQLFLPTNVSSLYPSPLAISQHHPVAACVRTLMPSQKNFPRNPRRWIMLYPTRINKLLSPPKYPTLRTKCYLKWAWSVAAHVWVRGSVPTASRFALRIP
jgi:hypothetical protein